MREIKFEVWDPNTERMWKNVGIDKISHYDDPYGDPITEQEPLIIRQYTGLKDKNGKEIYEDDIIQIKGHPFEGAMKIDNNYRVSFNERMELCAGSWLLHRVLYCSEVIGNMMEHPHLLEGRDEA